MTADEYTVGGLVGGNRGTITNSTNSGSVTAKKYNVGGLVGGNEYEGTIIGGANSGSVTGSLYNVGGLVGSNEGGHVPVGSRDDATITGSSSTGDVTGTARLGAMVGEAHADGTITNSSGAGTVTQLPLGRASASVTDAGLVSWSYQLKDGVSFSYVQVRWIEKPATGSPNWGNATKHLIWDANASSYQITGLTSGTEYVVRLFFGLNQNGFNLLKADAGAFTPSG